jgi:glycosyltransferase involved in cell wall biosynthesis
MKFLNNCLLPPLFFPGVKRNKISPYFGIIDRHINGPGIRTKRLATHFGNHFISPNIIYAQSGWRLDHLNSIINRRPRSTPIVFNQNGWFFPAWFDGDSIKNNHLLAGAHKNSDLVIFQSKFSVRAMEDLTGIRANNPIILYNSVPPIPSITSGYNFNQGSRRPSFWLGGVFHNKSKIVIEPALRAIEILNSKIDNQESPFLILGGYFTDSAKSSCWYPDLMSLVQRQVLAKRCIFINGYDNKHLQSIYANVSIALHLTEFDACPNAVLERMQLGIGHVYVNSGGTPELVGDAGISLNSRSTWDSFKSVDLDELIEAMRSSLSRVDELGELSRNRFEEKFSWKQYIDTHEKYFYELL